MIIGLAIRAGVMVGAVYYSRELGVWGDSTQTEKLYNDVKNELRPHVQQLTKQIPIEIPALPKSGEVYFLANHYYNQGVKSTFHFIEMIPCHMGQLMQKAKTAFNEFSQTPQPITSSSGSDK